MLSPTALNEFIPWLPSGIKVNIKVYQRIPKTWYLKRERAEEENPHYFVISTTLVFFVNVLGFESDQVKHFKDFSEIFWLLWHQRLQRMGVIVESWKQCKFKQKTTNSFQKCTNVPRPETWVLIKIIKKRGRKVSSETNRKPNTPVS